MPPDHPRGCGALLVDPLALLASLRRHGKLPVSLLVVTAATTAYVVALAPASRMVVCTFGGLLALCILAGLHLKLVAAEADPLARARATEAMVERAQRALRSLDADAGAQALVQALAAPATPLERQARLFEAWALLKARGVDVDDARFDEPT